MIRRQALKLELCPLAGDVGLACKRSARSKEDLPKIDDETNLDILHIVSSVTRRSVWLAIPHPMRLVAVSDKLRFQGVRIGMTEDQSS